MAKRFIILLSCVLLFTSCITRKKCEQHCKDLGQATIIDSVIYVEKIVDTTIVIPADSCLVTALFECDSLGNVYIKQINELKGKGLTTITKFKDNYIYIKTKVDTASIVLKYRDIIEKDKSSKTIVITKEVPKKINKFVLWWFWISLMLLIIYVIYRILKWRFGVFFRIEKN